MPAIWQDLANEFNKPQDQEVAIAKVNCEVERDLCYGKQLDLVFHSLCITCYHKLFNKVCVSHLLIR